MANGVTKHLAEEAEELEQAVHEELNGTPKNLGGVAGNGGGNLFFEGGLVAVLVRGGSHGYT